ncbi:dicarboxylate/amino acid:cation symporter [Caulobacter mirabilis]|uniref:Dicarboxylate/amino acid:cation symporter n=1 Tax=Caulobacter mirabilis TaxID=69666 RepID=A0A2D2AT36_9CAUL|nr:cation:dicarboxylase symporter family transporter [Caulobacter mirabilis]ATQ41170.1 dicarboxylate/amino acid:cation symporter [Caulobacter mirabilis]
MLRSLSVLVLIGLVAGLLAGAAVGAWGDASARGIAEGVEAVGGLWLNLLRMTIVPLVFALLVNGVASVTDAASTGRLAARALALFAVMLVIAATYSTLATQGLLALWPIDPQGAAALRAGAGGDAAAVASAPPAFADWLRSLAPTNPIKAAAEDAILPLVVFGLFLGFAATRLPEAQRTTLTQLFQAVAEAMIVIVRWVLWAAPVGVFALSLGVGLRAGLGAAGVLLQYVVIVSGVTLGVALLPYIVVAIRRATGGPISLAAFARAAAPVQALAVSTQSSLASLPAMIERSRDDLGVSSRVTGLVLPLAVAVFRMTSPVANLAVAYFVAHLYGVEPTVPHMVGALFVALAISIGTVGLPGQISFFASMAPICLALGAPIEALPILLAVEVIPDIFRTVGNVTADMAVTAVLRRDGEDAEGET